MEVKESGDEDRRAGAFGVIDIAQFAGWGGSLVSQQFETKHRFKILYEYEFTILGKDQLFRGFQTVLSESTQSQLVPGKLGVKPCNLS